MKVTDNPTSKSLISEADIKQQLINQYKESEVRKVGYPTEIIDLPSKGMLYPDGHPLANGKIEMRYMTARSEDILLSQNYIRQGIVFDKLFQDLIVTPVDYDSILIGDKNAIMIAARVLGYGKVYDASYTCECGKENAIKIDLTSIKDKVIDETKITKHVNEFNFELPNAKRQVTFSIHTIGSEKIVDQELKALKKGANEGSKEITTRLKHIITSIDSNRDKQVIRNFVDNELFASDSRALRTYINQIQPDIDTNIEVCCEECSQTQKIELPMNVNFFYPKI